MPIGLAWNRTGWGRTGHYKPGLKRIAKLGKNQGGVRKRKESGMQVRDKPGGPWPPTDKGVEAGKLVKRRKNE